jgi:O-antigen ligase
MQNNSNKLQGAVEFLIYLSPFFIPLYLLKFQIYGIPFTVLEVFAYALFAVWFIAVVFRRMPFTWAKPLRYYWIGAFMLFLGATIGVFASPHFMNLPNGDILDAQRVALGVWKGWMVAPMLYFAVLTQAVRSPLYLEKLMRVFVYSSAIVALSSYILALFGKGITYDFRLSGIFESANYLSLYLVPALLVSGCFIMKRSGKADTLGYLDLISFVVMAHAIFFTKSYAAIIAVFGAFVLYMLYMVAKGRVKMRTVIAGILALLATFIVVMLTQINTPKFKQFVDWENRSSTSVRLEIYEIAWNLIDKNPLTGVGPGLFQANYQIEGPRVLGHAPMEWNIPHPHNIFFAFWLNAGLLGLLALLFFLILAHRKFTCPLIAFWGIIIHGFFDTPFWKNDLSMIFWFILGAIVITQTYGTLAPQIRPSGIRKRLTPRISKRPKVERPIA